MKSPHADQLAVLVLSCDKYADLWRPYFTLFFRYWPQCPFEVYLLANHLHYAAAGVKPLLVGDDRDWSSSLKKALRRIPHDYVLTLFEDVFLRRPVADDKIAGFIDWALRNRVSYLRMRAAPQPDVAVTDDIGLIKPGVLYRTPMTFAVWRKETLLDLLCDGESPWQFEMDGARRSDKYHDFYSTRRDGFDYFLGVERGQWLRAAVREMRRQGVEPDLAQRGIMGRWDAAKRRIGMVKGWVLHRLPSQWRPGMLRLARSFYRAVGLK